MVKDVKKTEDLDEALSNFQHLRDYYDDLTKQSGQPEWMLTLDRSLEKLDSYNILYPVGDPIFIHVQKEPMKLTTYNVIEPSLTKEEKELYEKVIKRLIELGDALPMPKLDEEVKGVIIQLYDKIVRIGNTKKSMFSIDSRIPVTEEQYEILKYFLLRDRVEYGKLAPLFLDPYLEDIHCTGIGRIYCIHKIFKMVMTNLIFDNDFDLNKYMIEVSERAGRPVSDAISCVDAVMPDGSRANFLYGRDVSLGGSSFTIRKFSDVPVSITQLVNWNTFSRDVAAYLWLALENGMNMFICGETASGKTTTLNASSAFIKPEDKVYTVENTPEVTMPHDVWQHLSTRESGLAHDITYQDLLIAALRSRPNYIIVGEIRGEEGLIAFQAMQTGHSVMSTFHAGSATMMIQRLTGNPINVPITSIDNLNIVLIQMAVQHEGHTIRRVLEVVEIVRYYEPENKMVTRKVFDWNPVNDKHDFVGMFNSYVLEEKIAKAIGYSDTREIYNDLKLRAKIIDKMIELKIFDYYKVWDIIKNFRFGGVKSLPFKL